MAKISNRTKHKQGDSVVANIDNFVLGVTFAFCAAIALAHAMNMSWKINMFSYGALLGALYVAILVTLTYRLNAGAHERFVDGYKMRKKQFRDLAKKQRALQRPFNKIVPMLYPDALHQIITVLNGTTVETPDTRPAAWRLADLDPNRECITLKLRYTHKGLGLKNWQVYPRMLTLTIRLKSKGTRTGLQLHFDSHSPMDNVSTQELIAATNAAIDQVMREPEYEQKKAASG